MKYILSILLFFTLVFASCSGGVDAIDENVPPVDNAVGDSSDTSPEVIIDDSPESDEAANDILQENSIDTQGAESILNEW